jgi:hypothetical protein
VTWPAAPSSRRCLIRGHRSGKRLASAAVTVERIEAAVNARSEPNFVLVARTDALATEGVEGAREPAGTPRRARAVPHIMMPTRSELYDVLDSEAYESVTGNHTAAES